MNDGFVCRYVMGHITVFIHLGFSVLSLIKQNHALDELFIIQGLLVAPVYYIYV